MSKLPMRLDRALVPRFVEITAILSALSLLSACGGGGGGSSSTTTPANTAPTAISSTVQASEDTTTAGTLSASDANGDPLTFSIVSQASMGTASITNTSTGAFTYTPNLDESGTDSFTFKANDGTTDSNTATITVTVTAVEDAPVAQDGSLTTNEDIPTVGILVATDVEMRSLTYSIVNNGSQGNATITDPATGTYIYVPGANTFGTDSITFKANDGVLDSNVATVNITINPINDAPVAQTATLNTNEDTPHAGTLIATDAEMQPLTYSIVSNGFQGNAAITDPATGAFIYTPDPDSNGSDNITFQASLVIRLRAKA